MEKPMRECNKVGCHELIPFDQSYCDHHLDFGKRESNKAYDFIRNRKDKQYRRIYQSSRWQHLRRQVLLRDGFLCQNCQRNGVIKTGDVVDHIVELKDDMSKAFDMDNLETLCHKCHNHKTYITKQKRGHKSPYQT